MSKDEAKQKLYTADSSSTTQEVDAKKNLSDFISSRSSMPPEAIYRNTDSISQKLYGKKVDAPTLFQKVKNAFVDIPRTQSRIDELSGLQYSGDTRPDIEKEIKDLQGNLSKTKGLGDFPDAVAGIVYQLGYQGIHAAGTIGGMAQTVVASALGPILGWDAAKGWLHSTEGESNKVFGSLVGGAYRSLVDRGVEPSVARSFAGGMGVLQVALMTIPVGKAAGKVIEDALVDGVSKAAAKGALDQAAARIPEYLGMDVATAATAKAFGKQGLFAVANAAASTALPEVAISLSNRIKHTNIPLKEWGELGKDFLVSAGAQFVAGSVPTALHEAIMSRVGPKVNAELQTIAEKHSSPEVERPKAIPMPGRTVGQILDEISKRPPVMPEGLDVATRSSEGSAEYVHPTVEELQSKIAELPQEVRQQAQQHVDVAKQIRDIGSIDTHSLPTQAVVDELTKAVKENEGKPLFYDYTERLRAAQAKMGLRDTLEAVRDRFSLVKHTNAKLSQLEGLARDLEGGKVPINVREEDIARLSDLGKRPLRDLAPEDLKLVHDLVMRTKRAAEEMGTVAINGIRTDLHIARDTLTAEMPAKLRDETFWRKAKTSVEHYQTMITEMFGGEKSTGYKLLMGDLDTEEPWSFRRDQWKPVHEWMKTKGHGEKWFSEKMKVEGMDRSLTRDQVIAINGILSQENGLESLKNEMGLGRKQADRVKGASEEFFNNVKGAMDSDMKDFLDVVYENGKSQHDTLRKAAIRLNEQEPELLDKYYPFHRMQGSSLEEDMLSGKMVENQSFLPGNWDPRMKGFRASIQKGHMIPRVDSKAGLWIRGALSDLHDSIDFSADYIHLAEKVRNAAKLAWDPGLSKAIEERFGSHVLKTMRKGLLAFSGQRDPALWPEKILLDLRRKGITGVLGWNVPNAALNRTLMQRALAFGVPVGDMVKATAQMIGDPVGTRKWWAEHSGLAYSILSRGTLPEMGEAQAGGGKFVRKVTQVSMAPEMWGFGGAAVNEMQGSFNQAIREMRNGKLSENVKVATGLEDSQIPQDEAAREKSAIKYAEWVTKRTHAVPRELYQTNLSREGIVGRLVTTLYSERGALLNMGMRILNSNAPNKAGQFVKYVTIGVLGEALTIAGIRYLADQGKELVMQELTGKKDRGGRKPKTFLVHALDELANQMAGLIPVAGQVEYAVQSALSGGRTAPSGSVYAPDFTGSAFRLVQGVKSYVSTRNDRKKAAAALRTINEFLSITLPYGAGLAYSHSLRFAIQAIERGVGK